MAASSSAKACAFNDSSMPFPLSWRPGAPNVELKGERIEGF